MMEEHIDMWFIIGFVAGISLMSFLIWLEKKYFIFSDLLFDLKNLSDKDDIGDMPHGRPMPYKEWKRRNGL